MCSGRVFREPPGLLTIQPRVHSPSFTHLLIWMAPVQYLIYLCPLFVYLYDINYSTIQYLSICLSICLSVYLSIYPSIYLSFYLAVSLSICMSVYLSIYLSIYLSVCLSTCLPVYLWCSVIQCNAV